MNIAVRAARKEAFDPVLRSIGFDGVDISFPSWDKRDQILSEDFEDKIMKRYSKLFESGLKVLQTHLTYYPGHLAPLGNGTYEEYEAYFLPVLQKEIALTAKMNCNIAVIHLYFNASREVSREKNLALIEKLMPALEKNNVTLAIENIYGKDCGEVFLTTAEDLLFYTDRFPGDRVGVCLDTGHAVGRRQDPIEMAKKLSTRLKALHVHSNVPGHDVHMPPAFFPNVNILLLLFSEGLNSYGLPKGD